MAENPVSFQNKTLVADGVSVHYINVTTSGTARNTAGAGQRIFDLHDGSFTTYFAAIENT